MPKTKLTEPETTSGNRRKKTNITAPAETAAVGGDQQIKELPEFTKYFCDVLGDLVLRGGHEDDVKDLVTAVVSHDWRRRNSFYTKREDLAEYLNERVPKWRHKLTVHWPQLGEFPDTDTPKPESVTARIRADLRRKLQDDLNKFVKEASPEEVLLMSSIMLDYGSQSYPGEFVGEKGFEEIPLAYCFAMTFGDGERYIRVADDHWELVKDYLRLLEGKRCDEDNAQ